MRLEFRPIGLVFLSSYALVTLGCGSGEATAAPDHRGGAAAQHEGGTGHEGHEGMPGMDEHGKPARNASAWAELKALREAIGNAAETGKLGEIHELSERLGPLGQALAKGATSLPEDKRTRVEATLRQLPQIATALHTAADGGNADATRRELKRLDGLLSLIQAQYPADALEQVPAPGETTGGHRHSEAEPSGHEHAGHVHTARPLAAVDEAAEARIHVRAGEFKFEPTSLTMKASQPTRIELENHGAVEHALIVLAPDSKGEWIHLHAVVNSVDAATYRIDQPGRYRVLCTVPGHTEAGMVGELVVQ